MCSSHISGHTMWSKVDIILRETHNKHWWTQRHTIPMDRTVWSSRFPSLRLKPTDPCKGLYLSVLTLHAETHWLLTLHKLVAARGQQDRIYTVHPALCHSEHSGSVAYIMPAAKQSDNECAAVRRTSKLSHHGEWDEMRGIRSRLCEAWLQLLRPICSRLHGDLCWQAPQQTFTMFQHTNVPDGSCLWTHGEGCNLNVKFQQGCFNLFYILHF